MNSKQILFSAAVGLFGFSLLAQEKSKTYKETFNVSDDAVLEINTSHTDIEFDTWDKNQVEITAVITLDGASDEEAAVEELAEGENDMQWPQALDQSWFRSFWCG